MNDRVSNLIALMQRHRVVKFSALVFCALIVLTAVWLVAVNAFERFAENNENDLALAIATEQVEITPTETTPDEVRVSEAVVPAQDLNTVRPVGPRIDMIGEPTVDVRVGVSYTDDGARAFDAKGNELPIRTYVNGELTEMVMIDTSTPDVHEIEYRSTDAAEITTSITRTIFVH